MWEYTWRDITPWLKYRRREIIFREAVIFFMTGGGTKEDKEERMKDEYCKTCRQMRIDDCDNCSREIRQIEI